MLTNKRYGNDGGPVPPRDGCTPVAVTRVDVSGAANDGDILRGRAQERRLRRQRRMAGSAYPGRGWSVALW